MHCNQCEWTPDGGCTTVGLCGKEPDLNGLQELALYGAKGVSAYATHARDLGYVDSEVDGIIHKAMYTTLTNVNFDVSDHLSLALDIGDAAISVMELLDEAHTTELGTPEPTTVPQNSVQGRPILVTGHDMHAMKKLLQQTADLDDVHVYTHSEMLPAHSYPELAAFDHLHGNIGGAWHDQQQLFAEFPGPIVGTSNCLRPPSQDYADRFFTTGVTGLERATAIDDGDFSPVAEIARSMDPVIWECDETITTGFHHNVLLGKLEEVATAVDNGDIRRFFVVAGCDGPTDGREYYRELVEMLPEDCVVITSSCGKFRFNDLSLGKVPGTDIPRYIDVGQCNDSISAAIFAKELAAHLGCGVNDLPISFVLSWFEQKAVAVLLALLSLGVKDIYLGPELPEFLSPVLVERLNKEFGLQPTTQAQDDLREMLDTELPSSAVFD